MDTDAYDLRSLAFLLVDYGYRDFPSEILNKLKLPFVLF